MESWRHMRKGWAFFGERKAVVTMAKEGLMMERWFQCHAPADCFAVTRRFYELNTARQKVETAKSSLQAAETVAQATRARLDNGLATKPELLQADQLSAQAAFDLEALRGVLSDAQVALVESLGILPTARLQVAGVSDKSLSEDSAESFDVLMERALSQRPDLVAKLTNLRGRRAEVKKARAAYYPKIGLDAHVGLRNWT